MSEEGTPQEPIKIPDFIKNSPDAAASVAVAEPTPPPARQANAVFAGGTMAQVAHAQQMGKLDDVIPDETIPLPSMGKIYDEGDPLHMQSSIDIKVMTAREEDILTNRALIKKGTVITELLRSCIVNKAVNVDNMIAGDRNAVMVALRVTGYGSDYPVEIECSECGYKHKHSFTLSKLPVKTLDIDPITPGANLFKFKLPISQKTVYFKYLTGTDEEEISVVQEKMRKLGHINDNLITTRLKYSIQQIEDVTDKALIERFVGRMRARDSLALRKYMDRNEPTVEMKESVKCPACEHEEEVQVPIGVGFFWPDE
jgi:hypothetical protein